MKLRLIIPLSLAVVFLIIGIYEMMALGPSNGYWAVMLSVASFFYYTYRKKQG
ncbi:MAG: hypothetical protein JST43_08770 [Bacteroidetes bacterium]|nr:hypothetical protein [Bacteroidota bacterium]MBS1541393.1 hypothetical protein [Bacteroidota bacterium]